MTTFEKWDKEFRDQNMFAFNGNMDGILWLKIRAISRSRQMGQFLKYSGIKLQATSLRLQNIELFNVLEQRLPDIMSLLDIFLSQRSNEWYESMNVDEEQLKQDLYNIHDYSWGGDRNNSLDKYLVSRYVKSISRYEDLISRQKDIALNAWNYVQTSWYNNWTSYLIESLFKHHPNVVSAVGEIKSVDFFINDIPIDLKVTFFPHQYMETEMKRQLGKSELSWLKQSAKNVGINVGTEVSEKQQKYILEEKLSDNGHDDLLAKLHSARRNVVLQSEHDDVKLMTWLYENQGEMRFGSENRIYLVLVDAVNFDESWKMKRKFELIEPTVNHYLDHFNKTSLKEINFKFNGKEYKSLADIIFVIKNNPHG